MSITYDEIHRADAIRRATDFTHLTVAEALTQPQLGLWTVQCDTCAGECIGVYWIDLRKLRDDADVAEWTGHLNAKTWFAATNWGAVVASAGRRQPLPIV